MKSQKDSCIYLPQDNQNSDDRSTESIDHNVSIEMSSSETISETVSGTIHQEYSRKREQKVARKIHRLLVWLLLLGLLIGLPSSQRAQAQADIRLGTMIIAVSNASPPFAARASNGYLVGFDMDLITKLVSTAGLRVTYENAPFSQLIPGVSTHLYDAAISCIFVNEQRRTLINFSNTYFTTGTLLVVHKGNDTIHELTDLDEDTIVTVSEGSTAETFIREQTNAQVLLASSLAETLENVSSGNADAALTDEISASRYIKNYPDSKLKIVGGLITSDQCAIAVNKDNIQLLIELNAALTRLQNNGKFSTIYQRWFGSRPIDGPKPPITKTTTPTVGGADSEQSKILVDSVSGLYDVTVQTDPPTYQTIELAPDGRWRETVLTDVAARIQSGVSLEEAAMPQQQIGRWQIVAENSIDAEVEIQAGVPLATLSVPAVESTDITGDQAVTRTVSTPIRKEYFVTIAADGTLRGSYKLYAHQTAISESAASEKATDGTETLSTSNNQLRGTEIVTEVMTEVIEINGQQVIP